MTEYTFPKQKDFACEILRVANEHDSFTIKDILKDVCDRMGIPDEDFPLPLALQYFVFAILLDSGNIIGIPVICSANRRVTGFSLDGATVNHLHQLHVHVCGRAGNRTAQTLNGV
ncbi:MAG: hypothetical protein II208_00535, partial [Alphaproteobacteria bacterium]|nr:hypothetical protein [Alphaproteobacteria bacterium]